MGWDDDFSAEYFSEDPGMDGAWLVKMSYGEDLYDGGYMWISYADKSFASSTYHAYVFDIEKADKSNIYQYDGSFGYKSMTVSSGTSVSNVFTAKAAGVESLYKVGLGINDEDVDVEIQVYLNPTDENDPESGEAVFSELEMLSAAYHFDSRGFQSIELPRSVRLNEGDTFAVVARLSSADGDALRVLVDTSYDNPTINPWVSFTNTVLPGESFILEDGDWESLYEDGITPRLKAYTR